MKKNITLFTGVAGLLLLALATPTFAAEGEGKEKGKQVTITGEGKCGKCSLKETEKCQNVIEAKEDGKTVKYYLADNKESKEFHHEVCKESKKVKATGTVKEVDGKKVLTAKKIEVAEK
jgi:hypothetical protein